jgi:hypothetical protein
MPLLIVAAILAGGTMTTANRLACKQRRTIERIEFPDPDIETTVAT